MKKIIVSVLTILFLATCFTYSYAGNRYVTTGSGFFAHSEKLLDQALALEKKGQLFALWALIDSGRVKVLPANRRIKLYASNGYKLQVRYPRTSRTIWWTTRDALMLRGHEHLAK